MYTWEGLKCAPWAPMYTGYAGWAVMAGIPVKFGTAHSRSRPEVGGEKCIDVYGNEGVSRPSLVLGNSEKNIIAIVDMLRTIHNFYSLTVCS